MTQPVRANRVRSAVQRLLFRIATDGQLVMTDQDDGEPALVIAAHADDESLGCGGTIARKVAAGALVQVVFLTDGAASPWNDGLRTDELASVRRSEAAAASGLLGIPPEYISFLDFPDGQLAEHHDAATAALVALLRDSSAVQIFVPFRSDDGSDHDAAFVALTNALQHLRPRQFDIFEYPIWAWRHWPWVMAKPRVKTLLLTLRFGFGLRFLRTFGTVSPVAGTLHVKQAALAAHRTQMGPSTKSLATIDRGEFYEQFLREDEHFKRSSWPL